MFSCYTIKAWHPYEESNLGLWFRRPPRFPLRYRGIVPIGRVELPSRRYQHLVLPLNNTRHDAFRTPSKVESIYLSFSLHLRREFSPTFRLRLQTIRRIFPFRL